MLKWTTSLSWNIEQVTPRREAFQQSHRVWRWWTWAAAVTCGMPAGWCNSRWQRGLRRDHISRDAPSKAWVLKGWRTWTRLIQPLWVKTSPRHYVIRHCGRAEVTGLRHICAGSGQRCSDHVCKNTGKATPITLALLTSAKLRQTGQKKCDRQASSVCMSSDRWTGKVSDGY